jgi:hypothetical protein
VKIGPAWPCQIKGCHRPSVVEANGHRSCDDRDHLDQTMRLAFAVLHASMKKLEQ